MSTDLRSEEEAASFVAKLAGPATSERNAAENLVAKLGERLINRFHREVVPSGTCTGPTPVINFSDASRYTGKTNWERFPHHRIVAMREKLLTKEEPCDSALSCFERFYPVRDADRDSERVLFRYRQLVDAGGTTTLIGRCGTYCFLDMHQVAPGRAEVFGAPDAARVRSRRRVDPNVTNEGRPSIPPKGRQC